MLGDSTPTLLQLFQRDHLGLIGVDETLHHALHRLQLAFDALSFVLLANLDGGVAATLLVVSLEQLGLGEQPSDMRPNEGLDLDCCQAAPVAGPRLMS